MSLDHIVDLFPHRRQLPPHNTPLSQSSLAGLGSKHADMGVGVFFHHPSVLYNCSPMRYLTHIATTPSMRIAYDRRLLLLTPLPTPPVICVNLETRVAPSLARTGSRSTPGHSPYSRYSFRRSTSSCTSRKDLEASQRAEAGQRLQNPEKLRRLCPKGMQ